MKGDHLRYWPQMLTTVVLSMAVVWVSMAALLPEERAEVSTDEVAEAPPRFDEAPPAPELPPGHDLAALGEVEQGGLEPPPAGLEPVPRMEDNPQIAGSCPAYPQGRTRLEDLPKIPMMTRARLQKLGRSKKKSVVYATALFCKPCKLLSPVVAEMRGVVGGGTEVSMIVQEEDREDVLDTLGVHSFPSVVILEGDKVVDVRSGSAPWSPSAPCAHERNRDQLTAFFSSHGLISPRGGGVE